MIVVVVLVSCTISDKQPETPAAAPTSYSDFYSQIQEAEKLLKEGDLIVRNGQEFSSQLIKSLNRRDKSYSHAGLIFYKNGYPFVYHILAGDENPDQKMRMDSLKAFCNPRKNFGFAVYRYNLAEAEASLLKETVYDWLKKGISFDSTFNLKTDNRMYCSELIKKALANATKNRIIIETIKCTPAEAAFASTQLPLTEAYIRQLDLIPIENLYLNGACRLVKRFDFNSKK